MTGLQTLQLSKNNFGKIPTGIYRLTQLRALGLDFNRLESISNDIGGLTALEQLNISNNRFKNLPLKKLRKLKKLKLFLLTGNSFSSAYLDEIRRIFRERLNARQASSGETKSPARRLRRVNR